MNMYAYAGNNPVNRLDAQGTSWRNVSSFFTSEKVASGYYVGTGYGEEGVAYWAEKYTQTNNPIYLVPGSFSALWTPETYVQTVLTLLTAYQLNNAFIRTNYWQYYPEGNQNYISRYITSGKANPPYATGTEAANKLSLPRYNPGTAVKEIKVNPFKYLKGPQNIPPANGWQGGGIQYILPK